LKLLISRNSFQDRSSIFVRLGAPDLETPKKPCFYKAFFIPSNQFNIQSGEIMKLDEKLVQSCKDFIEERFPNKEIEGAAAMYTEDGEILISTAPEVFNSFAGLCHEAGAICEAYKKNKKITASVCISREKDGTYIIFPPCGICQERLYHWGGDVEVAVPKDNQISEWESKKLNEVQPFYWAKPFLK